MKTISWEIILAGLFFSGISIYLITQNSDAPPKHTESRVDSIRVQVDGDRIRVIELKSLENLKHLEGLKELEKLENLENIKNLENLKNLTNFLPSEIQSEFDKEIEEALREFEDESLKINFDPEKGTVEINKSVAANPGNWSVVSPGIYTYVKEIDGSGLTETELSIPFGSIEVVGSTNEKAKLTIQASGQIATKTDLQSKIRVLPTVKNQTAAFEVRSLKNNNDGSNNIHLQTTLSVPQNMQVNSSTGAGHVSSNDLKGVQVYETKGGHITLNDLSGEVEAKTFGGHIKVNESTGNMSLRSMGGHIRTDDFEGTLTMKTSGGNLEAFNTSGTVTATTNGGNIDLRFQELTGDSQAETGAGSITIWLPRNIDAYLDLSGSSIELDSAFSFDGNKSSSSVSGTLGNGGPVIKAKTNYGKVSVKVRD
ncbi:DUF4097 family beta strand repeat-containing protein [Gracilimonas mengyeensis]|uniref:Adhesin n=1 Tax=Gracilimonas mengyeensis TaxID=1302730 RepID=A0A521FM98_9BACT|nr:DUF4097 family beta strand repeat-containing protein [Gracilimonas mengyeensis]SMO96581.1 Putative adhesin [Gracilimonas mengyeensis]